MRELFGTDGVRGVANRELTVNLSVLLARAAATLVHRGGGRRLRVVIGKDTRRSGDMIEAAMMAGFCSSGADVIPVGVIPTPGIAYLARNLDVDMGVVISASHNPFEFNGIKFFTHEGYKLPDAVEAEIEELVEVEVGPLEHQVGAGIGRYVNPGDVRDRYLSYLKSLLPEGLSGLHVVVDCAHGACYEIAPRLFAELGARVTILNCAPDGVNINDGCGATHPEVVGRVVRELNAHVGITLDGDGDRLMLADEAGRVVNGDRILAMMGRALHAQGLLPGGYVVGTVMSNLGLERSLEQAGLKLLRTRVGDRYVLEEMRRKGSTIGGEQSGHIIFLDHATTGDGLVTALQVLKLLRESKEPLSVLANQMDEYPQELLNVTVPSTKGWEEDEEIRKAIHRAELDLGDDGRILVRASGTEPKIRVMVEGLQQEKVTQWVHCVADVIKERLA